MSDKLFNIKFITTGGTIEKTYDEFHGALENKFTQLEQRILHKLRLPYFTYKVSSLLSKDSLFFTDEDRELIVKEIGSCLEDSLDAVIVIHGTDTMAQTAELVKSSLVGVSIPIIFTGAMKPMGFDDSDALQNVTEALMSSRFLNAGVFISFHGQVFEVPWVRKNREKLTFESTKK